MLEISLVAEKIGSIGNFPITNSLVASWLTMGVLAGLTYVSTRSMQLIPGTAQSIAELVIGGLFDFFRAVTGKHAKHFFPVVASIFIFVIIANWLGLMPGFGTIGIWEEHEVSAKHETVIQQDDGAPQKAVNTAGGDHAQSEITEVMSAGKAEITEHSSSAEEKTETAHEKETEKKFVPVLRAATADLNMTIGLAIIAFFAIQYYGFKLVGPHYSTKFVNFSDPIMFYVGILELISDFSKIISFAFRLFGNIFAGEVLLAVMAFLMPFIVPLPFLTMELFVGFIQALVFSMLTAVFLNLAVSHGEEHH